MEYTLYIIDECKSCQRVEDHLRANKIQFRTVNLSDPATPQPDSVLIIPALFRGERLMAYGPDILSAVKA